jgi:hypothetical protein
MDGSWLGTWRTIHVISAIVFLVGHAVNMYAAFRFKTVDDVDSARRVLDQSRIGLLVAYLGLLGVLIAGVLAGISGQWFTSGRWWIWAAIVVLIAVSVAMTYLAAQPLAEIRWQLGAKNTRNEKQLQAKLGAPGQGVGNLVTLKASWNPWPVAVIGLVGLAVLLWLMYEKPF